MDRLPNATALEELVSCCRKISLLDITQGRLAGQSQYGGMYEMTLNRKWGWWEWRVSDRTGKTIMFGREISRSAARYKAARALFQLLLTSRLCDLEKLKRRQRR